MIKWNSYITCLHHINKKLIYLGTPNQSIDKVHVKTSWNWNSNDVSSMYKVRIELYMSRIGWDLTHGIIGKAGTKFIMEILILVHDILSSKISGDSGPWQLPTTTRFMMPPPQDHILSRSQQSFSQSIHDFYRLSKACMRGETSHLHV